MTFVENLNNYTSGCHLLGDGIPSSSRLLASYWRTTSQTISIELIVVASGHFEVSSDLLLVMCDITITDTLFNGTTKPELFC
jgi:hypothetical protein